MSLRVDLGTLPPLAESSSLLIRRRVAVAAIALSLLMTTVFLLLAVRSAHAAPNALRMTVPHARAV